MSAENTLARPDPDVAALVQAGEPWPSVAAAAAECKLGAQTLVIDVGETMAVTGHFVITNGNNTRQVKAIADEVERQLKLAGGPSPHQIEGLESLDWVLIDYGDFVVHVFSADAREYYQLERLWKDCPQLDWQAHLPPRPNAARPAPQPAGSEGAAEVDKLA